MKIEFDFGWLKGMTETSSNQIKVIAIIAILILMFYALHLGYDGALLASGIAIIAGLAGYEIGKSKAEQSQQKDTSPEKNT